MVQNIPESDITSHTGENVQTVPDKLDRKLIREMYVLSIGANMVSFAEHLTTSYGTVVKP